MSIVNRNITYRGRIKISTEDLEWAKIGRKKCTIRMGLASVVGDTIELTDGHERITARISSVDPTRRYGNLNDEDAAMEGFDSYQALEADLSKFYGRIDPMQPMTIIYFNVGE
ncbi:MAG: ASCH domain-containing protein [Pyrinomonadaceae bacterium]